MSEIRCIEINGVSYTEADVKNIVSDVMKAWDTVKQAIRKAINSVMEIFKSITEMIVKHEIERDIRHSWHLPKNTIKSHQTINFKMPRIPNIRNNI